jgi:hypothetical protein
MERKTITMTAWRRPQYFRRAVESLRQCNTTGWRLLCCIEPGCEENVEIARKIDWMPRDVIINPHVLGCGGNSYSAWDTACIDGWNDVNVHLEDDGLLSPDALDVAEWFLTLPPKYDSLELFSFTRALPANPRVFWPSNNFCAFSFVMTGEWYRKHHMKVKGFDKRGWDYDFNCYGIVRNVRKLIPAFSRSMNIGRDDGLFSTPEIFDRYFPPTLHYYHGEPVAYEVLDEDYTLHSDDAVQPLMPILPLPDEP